MLLTSKVIDAGTDENNIFMNNGREYNKLLLSAFYLRNNHERRSDLATVGVLQRRFEWLGNNECINSK